MEKEEKEMWRGETVTTMASDKIKVIQDWPEPRNVKEIQSFLG